MLWNYRVIEHDGVLRIHEAYYSDGDEKPHSITSTACAPQGDDIDELRRDLEFMLQALDQPVLDHASFKGG